MSPELLNGPLDPEDGIGSGLGSPLGMGKKGEAVETNEAALNGGPPNSDG